jgi:hypothetical protein
METLEKSIVTRLIRKRVPEPPPQDPGPKPKPGEEEEEPGEPD